MSEKRIELGDKVSVRLPGGLFYGEIRRILPWFHSGVRFEVSGNDPSSFITIVPQEGLTYDSC